MQDSGSSNGGTSTSVGSSEKQAPIQKFNVIKVIQKKPNYQGT